MKTFKLKQLHIVNLQSETYETTAIPLLDGLIINREDKENRWLIEAYTSGEFFDYFTDLKEKYKDVVVHVRITTESNEPATCMTSIIDINKIGNNMNVLLLGTMVDKRIRQIKKILEQLIQEGNRGEELTEKFKASL